MNPNQKNVGKKPKSGKPGNREDERQGRPAGAANPKGRTPQAQGGDGKEQRGNSQNRPRSKNKGRPQGQNKEKQGFREWDKQKNRPQFQGSGRPQTKDEPLFRKEDLPVFTCPLCDKDIQNVHSAVSYKGGPVHIECAIAMIQQGEELKPDERVCYIGGGAFGILTGQQGTQSKLIIKKRIQLEEKDKDQKSEWRKSLGKFVGDRIANAR